MGIDGQSNTEYRISWFVWALLLDLVQKALCQCGGSALTLTASPTLSKFTSPDYPTTGYTDNLSCEWLIDSGVAGQLVMVYSDHYNIPCALNDNLNIYDGSSTSAPLDTNLCGTDLSTVEYTSTDRYVLVTFTSDGSGVSQGFQMTYLSVPDTSGSGCVSEYQLNATSTPQYLTSEGFPRGYSSNSNCRWLIVASGVTSTIDVELTFSDIETDSSCGYDKMMVYTGSYICENAVLFTNCSSRTSADATPTVYTSSTNSVLVIFTSDSSANFHGFVLKYTANIPTTTTSTSTLTSTMTSTTTMSTTKAPPVVVVSNTTQVETVTQNNIPLLVVSAVSGAGAVLIVLAIIKFVQYIKSMKKPKKGVRTVQSIAPLPRRTTTYTHGQPPTALSFV